MFDWLGDLFSEDSINTIRNGINTAGSFFNAASPLINAGAQLGLGAEGTRNAAKLREDSRAALTQLDQLFTPDSPYAKEMRKQMERKDAAAGRRSQYGTRETELAANLAKQRSSVLTSPAYQALLVGANRSDYAPIAGAVGNLTGGLTGQRPGYTGLGGQQGGSGKQFGSGNVSGANSLAQYLGGLFGPGAEASIAQGIGGAGSALAGAGTAGGLGTVDALGSMLGGNPYLPGFSTGAEGIFGSGVMQPSLGAATGSEAAPASGLDAGALAGGMGDIISAGLGGAGSALSGMGAGSLAGTVGGTDALGGILGGTGFLPSYGAAGGTTATGIFGSGAGGAAGAAGGGAGAGSTAAGASGFALPALTALPFLAALYGFGSGILGKGDNGNPYTQSQEAMAQALYNQNQQGKINTLEDLNKFGGGDVQQYAQQQGYNPGDMNSYDAIRQQLQQQSGGGNFFGNFLSGNLMDNGGG